MVFREGHGVLVVVISNGRGIGALDKAFFFSIGVAMAVGLVQQCKNAAVVPAIALVAILAAGASAQSAIGVEPPLTATPQGECGPGSNPEVGLQGRVSREDVENGRAAEGYTCNTEAIGTFKQSFNPGDTIGAIGGFKVLRYIDAAGNECGFYDSSPIFGTGLSDGEGGVTVLDMSDSTNPVQTARLLTPGMDQPHESVVLSPQRGILAGITGTLSTLNGILDLYDVSEDCLNPTLLSTTPLPVLGHESGMSPDGMTFWSASTGTDYVFAVDISNTLLPEVIYQGLEGSHGITVSQDGNRTYLAGRGTGMVILDTTEIQERVANPTVTEISRLDWTARSIPQSVEPFTSNGGKYLMEIDEYGSCGDTGAGRIIDVNDEANPFVLSNLRLEVHNPENFDTICDDPGAGSAAQGYGGHYCSLPTRVDPTIIACSMIISGLRIFDITDVANPVEVAYFNAPVQDRPAFSSQLTGGQFEASNWAMSAPAYVPERNEIWYSDFNQGFFVVSVTNDVWPKTLPAAAPVAVPGPTTEPASAPLPVTGPMAWLTLGGLVTLLGTGTQLARRRRR
ncbi:MAG: hypothetical protein ACI867_000764 [Glaciecola sp.]|jgi:hypothetical protein